MEIKNYTTKQKVIILDLLKSHSDKHLTVDEMMQILYTKNVCVSRATLYRNLDILVLSGEVRKFYVQEDKACYQYIGSGSLCTEHFHLVCSSCGELMHLRCDEITKIINHINKEHSFLVDPGKVIFYGTCEKCLANKE